MAYNFKTTIDDKDKRIDIFLQENMQELTRSKIKTIIEDNKVVIDDFICKKAGHKLKENQEISVKDFVLKKINLHPQDVMFDIVYEDDFLMVINKPQNVVVHPGNGTYDNTLVNGLLYKNIKLSDINGTFRPGIVHRLDKDTSGLMLIAKDNFAHNHLAKQIEEKTCIRKYLALLEGNINQNEMEISTFLTRDTVNRKKRAVSSNEGKNAVSLLKVKQRYVNYTLCEFTLQTGRTHQIRVHSAFIKHPIVGDKLYGYKNQKFNLKGQLLHSYYIEFTHPVSNIILKFEIDLPEYYLKILNMLKKVL